MATTLLLDRTGWDLCVDAGGNMALATEPYAQLQDVASECRLFTGELWFETDRGVPYFDQVFNGPTPVQILKARLALAAEQVPDVTSATVVLSALTERTIGGQVQVTLADGTTRVVAL